MANFHFIRPLWLLALIPTALLVWRLLIAHRTADRWQAVIAPHLLGALLIRGRHSRTVGPLVVLAAVWMTAAIVLAGPTWRREPTPFAQDTAAMVIVLKVTSSMRTQDIQPDRLARSIQKIRDLLSARAGARSALIVYSGSIHTVAPLTNDPGIINSFAEAIDPAIMPLEGDRCAGALDAARQMLADAQAEGTIVWIADSVSAPSIAELKKQRAGGGIHVLAAATSGPELDSLRAAADALDARFTPLTPDDADLRSLTREAHYAALHSAAGGQKWHESGYALTPLIAFLLLPLFRRGALGSLADGGGAR